MTQKAKSIKTLAEEAGLNPQTVYSRVAKGWTLKKALSKPVRQYSKQGKVENRVKYNKVDNLDNIALEINNRKEETDPHSLDRVLVWATIATVIGALVGAFIGASL